METERGRGEMRRVSDRIREDQIYALAAALADMQAALADMKHDLSALNRALTDHIGPGETLVIERAATTAVERVFSMIGVDVHDTKDVQRFRDDLRFGAVIRAAAQKSAIAALTAIITLVVGALWFAVTHGGKQ